MASSKIAEILPADQKVFQTEEFYLEMDPVEVHPKCNATNTPTYAVIHQKETGVETNSFHTIIN